MATAYTTNDISVREKRLREGRGGGKGREMEADLETELEGRGSWEMAGALWGGLGGETEIKRYGERDRKMRGEMERD
jgi:hypothetical protein